jgi:hypothetical protein
MALCWSLDKTGRYAEAQKMQRLFLIICMVRMVKMLLR